ncbi:O-antigen ligase [Curtobacterium flaccumfaciens]|uniref:O-antigen ligase n=1 Tax=Curtobacterium salicis TaxID=1779862 RepID=A0ABX0T9U5_9MICO|nr:O-antigen ligase family protein [Curtobacterium sp. WW7]NII42310.1 O-antigen ligase [Curtobacterium sp. WW7]
MNSTYALGFGVLGLVMAVLFIRALRPMWNRQQWTTATVLGLITVLLPNATTAASVFLGSRSVILDGFYNGIVSYGGTAAKVNTIASPLLAVLALIVLAASLKMSSKPNLAPAAIAGLVVLGLIFGSLYGSSLANGGVITLLLVLIAAVFVPRGRGVLEGAAIGLALLIVLSLLGSLVAASSVSQSCGLRKCGALGFLFSGVADNNNAFGLLASMAIPVLYFGLRKHQLLFATAAAVLAVSSGSRTGAIAAACGLILCAIHKRAALRTGSLRLAIFAASVLGVGVGILPLLPLSPEAFTGRVALWRTAFSEMAKQPFIGHGGEFWRDQVNFRVIAHAAGYSTHNQFVESYFVAGIFGIVLLFAAVIIALRANRGHLGQVSILLVPILICALTERPWSLGPIDWLSWSLVVVLTIQFSTNAETPEELPAEIAKASRGPQRRRGRRPLSAGSRW